MKHQEGTPIAGAGCEGEEPVMKKCIPCVIATVDKRVGDPGDAPAGAIFALAIVIGEKDPPALYAEGLCTEHRDLFDFITAEMPKILKGGA